MKITLDLDDDVLSAVKEISQTKGITMGQVVSDLVRQALNSPMEIKTRNGVPLLPKQADGDFVTLEIVNDLRNGF